MSPTRLSSPTGSHQKLKLGDGATPRKSRFSKRFWILAGALVVVVAIALGVGLGVGLRHGNDGGGDDDSGDDDSPAPPQVTNPQAIEGSFWRPDAGTTWQIVLQPIQDTSLNVSVYDIDLYSTDASLIAQLHQQGRKVICYFSAGSYEDWRPDAGDFAKSDRGKGLDGWPGEWWLNVSSPNVHKIMAARLDLAHEKGCDGVDPDNIDGFDNDSGFDLTKQQAVDYLEFLAVESHARNMSIGLKNGGAIVESTLLMMQWQVNEQCAQYDECDSFQPFIDANKPVFHIEYPDSAPEVSSSDRARFCDTKTDGGFSTLLKKMKLDDWFETC